MSEPANENDAQPSISDTAEALWMQLAKKAWDTVTSAISTTWKSVAPWLWSKTSVAIYATLLTGYAQYYVQGLVRDSSVMGAELAAVLKMSGELASKKERKVEDVARVTASAVAFQCSDAIEKAAEKKPATAQRRGTGKPKETGSIW